MLMNKHQNTENPELAQADWTPSPPTRQPSDLSTRPNEVMAHERLVGGCSSLEGGEVRKFNLREVIVRVDLTLGGMLSFLPLLSLAL